MDFFGDGSFYLLDVPGVSISTTPSPDPPPILLEQPLRSTTKQHAVGHIAGLARTTPTTFVLMGGDVCHFGGSFRPTPYVPLPNTIPSTVKLDSRFSRPCPCSIFTACHPDPEHARTSPYYRVTEMEGSWYIDPPTAQASIDKLEEFDADEDVFVAVAHDEGLIDVCDWFPKGSVNAWKEKGWKEASRWGFLNELPVDGKPGRKWIAPGLMRDGKVVS